MKNTATENFLAVLAAYMPLSTEIIDLMLPQLQVRQLKKNSPLPNFRNDYLFVVSGLLKKEDCESGDIQLFLQPGDFELFARGTETFHYCSIEESTVVLFPVSMLVDLVPQHRAVFEGYQQIVHQWCALRSSRQELLLLKAPEKKAELYRRLGKCANSISNKDLARYLAMDSSYFSSL